MYFNKRRCDSEKFTWLTSAWYFLFVCAGQFLGIQSSTFCRISIPNIGTYTTYTHTKKGKFEQKMEASILNELIVIGV